MSGTSVWSSWVGHGQVLAGRSWVRWISSAKVSRHPVEQK
jgi:hypothetical protein